MTEGETKTRKYQNPSRKKMLAVEILGILVTSHGNMGAYLKPPPDCPLSHPCLTLYLLLTHENRRGRKKVKKLRL